MAKFSADRDDALPPETFDFNSSLLEVLKDILAALRRIEFHLQIASDEELDDEELTDGSS